MEKQPVYEVIKTIETKYRQGFIIDQEYISVSDLSGLEPTDQIVIHTQGNTEGSGEIYLIEVIRPRLETDEEVAERWEKENKRIQCSQMEREAKERIEYERLKAKFENK